MSHRMGRRIGWWALLALVVSVWQGAGAAESFGKGYVCRGGEPGGALSVYVVGLPESRLKLGQARVLLRSAESPETAWETAEATGGDGSGALAGYWLWRLNAPGKLEMVLRSYVGTNSPVPTTVAGYWMDRAFNGVCQWKNEVTIGSGAGAP